MSSPIIFETEARALIPENFKFLTVNAPVMLKYEYSLFTYTTGLLSPLSKSTQS